MNTHVGQAKKTNNQIKKHVSQMSFIELNNVVNFFKNETVKHDITLSNHLKDKVMNSEVVLNTPMLANIFGNVSQSIIEYNVTNGTPRLLLRSSSQENIMIDNKYQYTNLCIVIDLLSFRIVTAYHNLANDFHDEIDYNRYDENMEVQPYDYIFKERVDNPYLT